MCASDLEQHKARTRPYNMVWAYTHGIVHTIANVWSLGTDHIQRYSLINLRFLSVVEFVHIISQSTNSITIRLYSSFVCHLLSVGTDRYTPYQRWSAFQHACWLSTSSKRKTYTSAIGYGDIPCGPSLGYRLLFDVSIFRTVMVLWLRCSHYTHLTDLRAN